MKKSNLFITCLFCLLSLTLFSQWQWQNPYPQGNTLNDVFLFDQNVGWAVGDWGTIIKTVDGGSTWEVMESFADFHLNAVKFNGMNTGISVGNNGTILKTIDGGLSWTTTPAGIDDNFTDISFISSNKIWIVGDNGNILYSNEEGNNWVLQFADTTVSLSTICFLDDMNGWAAGGNESGQSVVLQTSDGGETWTEISGGTLLPFHVLYFVDPNIGWAIINDEIYKTTNGGSSWFYQFEDEILSDLFFTDSDNGWAIGGAWGVPTVFTHIFHTSDGGNSWEYQESFSYGSFNGVYFTDNDHGHAVGTNGNIHMTSDGGENWEVISWMIPWNDLHEVFFTDNNNGWAIGGSWYPPSKILLHTSDGGDNWQEQSAPSQSSVFYGVFFIDPLIGWVVGGGTIGPGSSMIILHTDDGGQNWGIQYSQNSGLLALKDIIFTDSQNGWAVGGSENLIPPQGSLIFHTIDGGDNWEDLSWLTDKSLTGVCFTDSDHGWIVGHEIIMKTNDGGQTWDELFDGMYSAWDVCFVDSEHGWILCDSASGSTGNMVIHTSDGGITWEQQYYNDNLKEFCFSDTQNGWILGDNVIHYTNDGGNTWEMEPVYTDAALLGMFFTDQYNGWVAGQGSTILHTGNGGMVGVESSSVEHLVGDVRCYPNPFQSNTTIEFSLPETGLKSLSVYDISGKLHENIISEKLISGNHKFEWNAKGLPPGIYFLRLESNGISETKKLLLIE